MSQSTWQSSPLARVVVGFLVAPLVPALVMEFARQLHLVVGGFEIVFYAYPIAWMLGLPAFVVFYWRGWNRLLHYVCGSFAVMFAFTVAVLVAIAEPSERGDYRGMAMYAAMMGGLALVAAASFWFIAVRGAATGEPVARAQDAPAQRQR